MYIIYDNIQVELISGGIKMKNRNILICLSVVVLCAVAVTVLGVNFSQKEEPSQTATQETTIDTMEIVNNVSAIIDKLAQTDAANYSDPADLIDKNSEDYKYLLNHPDQTAKSVFNEFLETSRANTLLDGEAFRKENVMAVVLKDILGGEALKDADADGGDYFEEFWIHNVRILLLNDEEFMSENYKYGYLLIQLSREKLISLFSDDNRAEEINRRIYLFDDLSNEKNIPLTDVISCVTNSEYLGSTGTGITIHKFRYSDTLTFNVGVSNDEIVSATYYIDGKEYAYSGSYGDYNLSENTNNVDNSNDVKLIANDENLKNTVVSELKKSKYKDYVTSFDENDIGGILCYRVNTSGYTFVYETEAEYSYAFGVSINNSSSEYSFCRVVINAQTGQVMALYFRNSYDN